MHQLWAASGFLFAWLDREAPGLLLGFAAGVMTTQRFHRRFLRGCYYENWVEGYRIREDAARQAARNKDAKK